MDGRFVPNITIGPLVVAALRRVTRLPLEVHLMIQEPDRYLEAFIGAGASTVIVHGKCCRTFIARCVRSAGSAQVNVALNPSTPIAAIHDVGAEIDHLLIMSVNPGFGGQTFIPHTFDKLREARELLSRRAVVADIEVDGGVSAVNAAALVEAGVTILVAGSAIFGEPNPRRPSVRCGWPPV